jgi:hypothetical protein
MDAFIVPTLFVSARLSPICGRRWSALSSLVRISGPFRSSRKGLARVHRNGCGIEAARRAGNEGTIDGWRWRSSGSPLTRNTVLCATKQGRVSTFRSENRPWPRGVIHVRTHGSPGALLDPLRQSLVQVDASVPIRAARTLRDQAEINLRDERLASWIGLMMAGASLLLAAIGLYATTARGIAQRKRELGVRIALGATGHHIRRLIVGQAVRLSLPAPCSAWV